MTPEQELADTNQQLADLYEERDWLFRDEGFEPGTFEAARARLDRAIRRLEALRELDELELTRLAREVGVLTA